MAGGLSTVLLTSYGKNSRYEGACCTANTILERIFHLVRRMTGTGGVRNEPKAKTNRGSPF